MVDLSGGPEIGSSPSAGPGPEAARPTATVETTSTTRTMTKSQCTDGGKDSIMEELAYMEELARIPTEMLEAALIARRGGSEQAGVPGPSPPGKLVAPQVARQRPVTDAGLGPFFS